MSRPDGIAGDQLRAIVERIERIEDEIKELSEGKKEIYLEAKGNGFDVKIVRQVVRLRKQNAEEREERASLIDAYLQAIQNAAGAAKPGGAEKGATVARAKAKSRRPKSPDGEGVSRH